MTSLVGFVYYDRWACRQCNRTHNGKRISAVHARLMYTAIEWVSQGCSQDVKSQDRDKTETFNPQDRDETETVNRQDRDETETFHFSNSQDRDETDTFNPQDRDETESPRRSIFSNSQDRDETRRLTFKTETRRSKKRLETVSRPRLYIPGVSRR